MENDTSYILVLIWAFIGIKVSQAGSAFVATSAWAGVLSCSGIDYQYLQVQEVLLGASHSNQNRYGFHL